MSKLTPRLAHMRRTLLGVGIISLAITANTLQPPSTAAAAKAGVAAGFGGVKFLVHGRWGSNLTPTSQNFVVTNANNNGPGLGSVHCAVFKYLVRSGLRFYFK